MSESKQQWTPGPWEVDATGYRAKGDGVCVMAWPRCVAVIGAFNPDMPNDANAKLIAAAPELVEALSELLEYAVILGADYLDTFRDWPADATIQGWPKERWIRAREAEDKARAALAKAGA